MLTDEKLDGIATRLETSPRKSLVHLAHQKGVSASSAWIALKLFFLYQCKTAVIYTLYDKDQKQEYLDVVHDGDIDPLLILWCHINVYVGSQNNIYWSAESPMVVHDTEVSMWCAVSATMTIVLVHFS
jgi:hypothetical protein